MTTSHKARNDKMWAIMRVNELTDQLIEAQEAQLKAINDLMQTLNEYMESTQKMLDELEQE